MPTIKQLSRIFSDDASLNRLQDQLASALNPILRNVQGDLSGPLESPLVVGLQGRAVSTVAPAVNQALVWTGKEWAPGSAGGGSFVTSVTASSPLASSGGLTPNISLSGIVGAANGGTGLSSSGVDATKYLGSDGAGGWQLSTPSSGGGTPSGPAGGVLGYTGSTYPNPNGLASGDGTWAVAGLIPIKNYNPSTVTIKIQPDASAYAQYVPGQSINLCGGDTSAIGTGGNVAIIGGSSSVGAGGTATVTGGIGSYAGGPTGYPGGDVVISGGTGARNIGGSGGQTRVSGGFGSLNIFNQPIGTGGDLLLDGGLGYDQAHGGRILIGTSTYAGQNYTSEIDIGLAGQPPVLRLQGQQVDITTSLPTTGQALVWNGSKWAPASASVTSASPRLGHVAVVDAVNGNDSTGAVNGSPFLTVEAGLAAITAAGAPATLWIMPGTYTLASATTGLTMPTGCAMRGLSLQTTKIVMNASNPGNTVTMLTMADNSRVEDLTFQLLSSNATTNLVGVHAPGTSSTTSKIRTAVVTVDNSGLAYTATTNVYGILDDGTGSLGASSFSFNFTRAVTVNVLSNGGGNKRGVYVTTANDITFRDTNIYVAAPVNASSTGSYVGVETTNAGCSAQFRTSSISGASTAGSYTGSDLLQTAPGTGYVTNGIQIGPGCDLINKTAGGKSFTTYVTPTTLTYGFWGNIPNSVHYMWPGTLRTNLDNNEVFYRVQQKCIIQGMSFTVRTAPGTGKTLTVTVNKSTTGVAGSGVATVMTQSISNSTTTATQYAVSVDLAAGDYISVETTGTSGLSAQDLVVELDLF